MSENRQEQSTKMEEYKMLREELNDAMKTQDSLINICLTSVTAVLAFAFSQHLSVILLAAYPIIYFLLCKFIRHRERVVHISGYLIVYLEPIIGFTWETHNYIAYTKENKQVSQLFWETPHYHFWEALAFMTLCASILIDCLNHPTVILITVVQYIIHFVAIIVIHRSSVTLAKASELRKEKVQYWTMVKNNISEDNSNS